MAASFSDRAFLILSSTSLKSMIPLFSRNAKVSSGVNIGGFFVSVVTVVTVLAGVVLLTVTTVTAVTDLEGENSAFRMVSSVGVLYPFIK